MVVSSSLILTQTSDFPLNPLLSPPMNFSALLYGIGAIGPFSSRVFLPAF